MDVALLFFLPLLGGFRFVQTFVFTSFRASRADTQRLYYQAAIWGIVFAVLGFWAHRAFEHWTPYRAATAAASRDFLAPLLERTASNGAKAGTPESAEVRIDVAFACIWAFGLGLATPLFNRLITLVDAILGRFVATAHGRSPLTSAINASSITDQFEKLLNESVRQATLVQCTLSNAKVYVGWVTEPPNPLAQEKYFRIQPSMSGHRSADDGQVAFTTFYDDILQKYEHDPARLRAYEIVIPMDKIVSASGFDLADYVEFQKKPRAERPPPPPTVVDGEVTVYLGRPLRRS